jgi:hypothetical protein
MDPHGGNVSERMAPPRSRSGSNISGLAPTTLGRLRGLGRLTDHLVQMPHDITDTMHMR